MTSDERIALVRAASDTYRRARATLDAAKLGASAAERNLRLADAALTDSDRAKMGLD